MLKDSPNVAETLARRLTEGYADHGYCINVDEAREIGLKAEELAGDQLEVVWNIHCLVKRKRELERAQRQRHLEKKIKDLPPELIDKLPPELVGPSEDRHRVGASRRLL